MNKREKEIIIDEALTSFSIKEEKREIYLNNKTVENRTNYLKWEAITVGLEVLAKHLGINILNGEIGGADEEHMRIMKRV